jgi:hypothetical protein
MPDYGHELAFGTSMAAQSRRLTRRCSGALAEQVALDLATFQTIRISRAQHPRRVQSHPRWAAPGTAGAVGARAARDGARARVQHLLAHQRGPADHPTVRRRAGIGAARHAGATAGRGHDGRGAPRPQRAGPPTWGIDYKRLPGSVSTKAIEPGDKRYARVRSTYTRTGSPGPVIGPDDLDDVIAALACALTATRTSPSAPSAQPRSTQPALGHRHRAAPPRPLAQLRRRSAVIRR